MAAGRTSCFRAQSGRRCNRAGGVIDHGRTSPAVAFPLLREGRQRFEMFRGKDTAGDAGARDDRRDSGRGKRKGILNARQHRHERRRSASRRPIHSSRNHLREDRGAASANVFLNPPRLTHASRRRDDGCDWIRVIPSEMARCDRGTSACNVLRSCLRVSWYPGSSRSLAGRRRAESAGTADCGVDRVGDREWLAGRARIARSDGARDSACVVCGHFGLPIVMCVIAVAIMAALEGHRHCRRRRRGGGCPSVSFSSCCSSTAKNRAGAVCPPRCEAAHPTHRGRSSRRSGRSGICR